MQNVSSAADRSDTVESTTAESTSTKLGVLSALTEFPAFRRLWFGAMASSLGQWMQATALGWLALEISDSASFVGFVAFAAGLPFLIIAIPGGLLIDRFDRRHLLITCQGLAMILSIVVATDVITGTVEAWHLLVAAFLNGSLQAILNPTQQSLVAGLVPKQNLTNAIGLMSAGQNMTRVVGPSIAGATIGFVGTGQAFLLQALCLIVSMVLIGSARFPSRFKSKTRLSWEGLADGLRLVGRRPDLRALFLLAAIPTFLVFPYISFLSVYARDILEIGATGLGILLAASGLGAVVGSLLVAFRPEGSTSGRTIILRTILYGFVIVGFSLSRTVWLSLPLLFAAGFLGSNFMSANNAMIQHRITDEYRGRVMGIYMMTWGLMPLGALPMGVAAEHWGVPVATAFGAGLSSVILIILAWRSEALLNIGFG